MFFISICGISSIGPCLSQTLGSAAAVSTHTYADREIENEFMKIENGTWMQITLYSSLSFTHSLSLSLPFHSFIPCTYFVSALLLYTIYMKWVEISCLQRAQCASQSNKKLIHLRIIITFNSSCCIATNNHAFSFWFSVCHAVRHMCVCVCATTFNRFAQE